MMIYIHLVKLHSLSSGIFRGIPTQHTLKRERDREKERQKFAYVDDLTIFDEQLNDFMNQTPNNGYFVSRSYHDPGRGFFLNFDTFFIFS